VIEARDGEQWHPQDDKERWVPYVVQRSGRVLAGSIVNGRLGCLVADKLDSGLSAERQRVHVWEGEGAGIKVG